MNALDLIHRKGDAAAVRAKVDPEEVFNLGMLDGEFFCHQWFPRAFRDESPDYHHVIWNELEGRHRFVSAEVYRGGSKTTLLRAFCAKRISYAESNTIMIVSSSQDHAKRSVRWLRRQVMFNTAWANFYNLKLGTKKTDEWLEIVNTATGQIMSIVAVGITGQTRGINLDDFRPDLILVDDPCNEENTGTVESRKKINDLFFGALAKSLAPPTENPNALMVLLQTPLNSDDLISRCGQDPQWRSMRISCFDRLGKSRWEVRYPTEFLLSDKRAHAARNDSALWFREMECKIVSEASSSFRASWLQPWPIGMTPRDLIMEGGQAYLWIDPVPPPSERQINMGLKGKDYEVLAVVVRYMNGVYLAEYAANRGHDPDWTVREFWHLVETWNITQFGVETTNYQRTLKWLLEKSMKVKGRYIQTYVPEKTDQRKKSYRIIDSLKDITSQGEFYVNFEQHTTFVSQFTSYPDVDHDDVLEAVSEATRIALEAITLTGIYTRLAGEKNSPYGKRKRIGACP